MSRLKNENLNQCFSLLREFIDGASAQDKQKGIAVMALDHLKKITAGDGPTPASQTDPKCNSVPRGDA